MTTGKDTETAEALLAYIRDRQRDEDGSGEWMVGALYRYTLDVMAEAKATDDAAAEAIAEKVVEKMQAAPVAIPRAVVSMAEAAEILGLTYNALRKRVEKHTFKPAKAIVPANGNRVEFYADMLRGAK